MAIMLKKVMQFVFALSGAEEAKTKKRREKKTFLKTCNAWAAGKAS